MRLAALNMILSVALSSSLAHAAFELSPIIATLTPGGPGATTSFTLTNSDDTKTPVQVGIFLRSPDLDGNEKFEEAKDMGDMFQVFPAQVILNAKETRTVRVTYVGDPKIKSELAFRVIAEEFPISVSDPKKVKDRAVASIAIATKYVGSLYVTPTGSKSDVVVEASQGKSKSGGDELVMTFENKGTEHQLLKNAKFKITTGGKEYLLPPESISKIGPQNILVGRPRKISIPWPNNVPVGPVKVTVELAKQ